MGTYRWTGWRLDVEIMQAVAQRLIYTKDAVPLTDAEEHQLLNDNGGNAAWQPVEHVAVGTLAAKKWRRVTDGAEAFILATDPHVMCLVTSVWEEAWIKAQQPTPTPQRNFSLRSVEPTSRNAPGPWSYFFAAVILIAGIGSILGCIGFLAWKIVRSFTRGGVGRSDVNGLWIPPTPPKHLESACVVTAPPPLPVSNFPKQRTLEDLSWQEFELMVGELYRRQGYTVEMCSGDGSDGGVDLRLRKDGKMVLVQCKHWKVYKGWGFAGARAVRHSERREG